MRLKNRILTVLCTVIATVSFLYPFSGKYVHAEPVIEEAAPEEEETEESVYADVQEAESEADAQEAESEADAQETETETGAQEAETETGAQVAETESGAQETETKAGAQEESMQEEETAMQEAAEKNLSERDNQEEEWEEPAQEEIAGSEGAAEKCAEENGAGDESGQSRAACIVEDDAQDAEAERIVTAARRYAAGRALKVSGCSIGISEKSPQSGQQNRYDAVGQEMVWTVPADGYYDLYCYGAQGGAGDYKGKSGSSDEGKWGDVIGRRYFLKKGTELVIQAGSQPQRSVAEGFGEGSTNGNPKEITEYGYSRKIWKHRKDTDYGVGTIWQYRGYPDGSYGDYKMTICNNVGSHSGGSTGGGGGGSSIVRIGSSLLLSAKGGSGGAASYVTLNNDGSGTTEGGGSSGTTGAFALTGAVLQNELNDSGSNSGDGYVVIRVASIIPEIALEADRTEWTNGEVMLRASAANNAGGLPNQYLSWETDADGNAVWTDLATYAVSQNGTYQCMIRNTAGNTNKASITVQNIDRLKPLVRQERSETGWTKEAVTLTVFAEDAPASSEDGCSGLPEDYCSWQEDESGSAVWTDENTFTVSENGTFTCKVRDNAGNMIKEKFSITEIDTTPPEVSCKRPERWYEGSAVIQIEAKDLQPDGTPGCGLAGKAYSTDGIHFTKEPEFLIPGEGTYTVWVKDAVGNIREKSFAFAYDEKEEEERKEYDEKEEEAERKETEQKDTEQKDTKKHHKDTEKRGGSGLVGIFEETIEKEEETMHLEYAEIPESKETKAYSNEKKPVPKTEPSGSPEELKAEEPEERELIRTEKTAPKEPEQEEPCFLEQKPEKRTKEWKKTVILYSIWMAVILCGLLWLLFSLLMEHAAVYMQDDKGKYRKIGLCMILRKKGYKQVNLIPLMKIGERRNYKVRFSSAFVFFHKKERLLIRTDGGVELRTVAKEIEIFSCNS